MKFKSYRTIAALLAALLLSGCGAPANNAVRTDEGLAAERYETAKTEIAEDGDIANSAASSEAAGRFGDSAAPDGPNEQGDVKRIRNANITLETLSYNDTIEALTALLTQYNGYLSYQEVYESGRGYRPIYYDAQGQELKELMSPERELTEAEKSQIARVENGEALKSAYFELRIPEESLDAFLNALRGNTKMGHILQQGLSVTDVTKSYRDTAARIRVLEEKQARLLELMKNAETTADLIALEESLSDTISEMEILNGDLASLDDQIRYATLQLHIEETVRYTHLPEQRESFGQKVATSFQIGLENVLIGLESFVLWVVRHTVALVVLFAVLAFVLVRIRRCRKNGRCPFGRKEKAPKPVTPQESPAVPNATAASDEEGGEGVPSSEAKAASPEERLDSTPEDVK